MKYLNKSFTVPAGSSKISDEDWQRAFSRSQTKPTPPPPTPEPEGADDHPKDPDQ